MKLKYTALVIMVSLICASICRADSEEKFKKSEEKIKNYFQEVYTAIMEHWSIPETYKIEGRNQSAVIRVFINDSGKITSHVWMRSTGDNIFDDACTKAIKETKKLPRPPAEIALGVIEEGIGLTFKSGRVSLSGKKSFSCPAEEEKIAKEGYKRSSGFGSSNDPYLYEVGKLIGKACKLAQFYQNKVVSRMEGVTEKLEAVFDLDVDSNGSIQNAETVCPSKISYFDNLVVEALKKIRELPKPPADVLGKDGHFKILLPYTVYKQNF